MIPFSKTEQKEFSLQTKVILKDLLQDKEYTQLLLKCLSGFIENTSISPFIHKNLMVAAETGDHKTLLSHVEQILIYMSEVAVDTSRHVPVYTIRQLAIYFGVSATTINLWIKAGRFTNVIKHEEDKFFVPKNSLWLTSTGKVFSVATVVEDYKKENSVQYEETDELTFVQNQLYLYFQKYNGTFEETLGSRKEEELTAEEESDKELWIFFLNKLKDIDSI